MTVALMFLKKYWKEVTVAVVLATLLSGLFLLWSSWKIRGDRISLLEDQLNAANQAVAGWMDATERQNAAVERLTEQSEAYKQRLEEELAKPPEVVTRIEERLVEVPVIQEAEDIPAATLLAADILKGAAP